VTPKNRSFLIITEKTILHSPRHNRILSESIMSKPRKSVPADHADPGKTIGQSGSKAID